MALPQWSPVVTTGTTRTVSTAVRPRAAPQWSPVVTTGTTGEAYDGWVLVQWAAMEPRRDDGDDARSTRGIPGQSPRRNGAPS